MTPPLSSYDVCRMAGITYRQLDYWVRTGLLTPSVRQSMGGGSPRRWSIADARRAKIVGLLMRSADWRSSVVPAARRLAQELPDMDVDGGFLIVGAAGVSWAEDAAQLVEACRSLGPGVWVLDLDEVARSTRRAS